ncbi:MAG TPA: 50S ribosomal protein L1 [archaeon]|nr:50S ribosomal protein L1 [archaeon]
MTEKTMKAIKELREKAKKRKFPQSFDLIISLKEFDTKKAENKFIEDIFLPHGRGKEASVVVFSDSLKDLGSEVLTTEDVNGLAKNKRKTKKLITNTDFFLAESKMMPLIGKSFGQFLAPRGKMPKIMSGDEKDLVKNYKRAVRIRIKDSPVIQCLVGNEDMKDEEVEENIESIIKFLESRLPKGKQNFGKILLKMTMSDSVKIGA